MTGTCDYAPLEPAVAAGFTDVSRVAFQGELGAYGDQAIVQHWHGRATGVPSASFEHVVAAVSWGLADYGILPVWNTVVGEIAVGCGTVRLAQRPPYGLVVVGDAHLVIRHQLLTQPGVQLGEIESVESHPVALAQCGRFFGMHPRIVPHEVYDTAGAARNIATHGTRTIAAIAGRAAADRYGLTILESDIQDVPDNVTRFFIIARRTNKDVDTQSPYPSLLVRW